ncbi:hypothetical protein D3C83_02030 [compost metagenome]
MSVHRLLEERERGVLHRAHVGDGLLGRVALVGVGAHEEAAVAVQRLADLAGALGVLARVGDADLDLERDVPVSQAALRIFDVGGRAFAGADHAQDRHPVAPPGGQQVVCRLAPGAAERVVQRDLDHRLGGMIAVEIVAGALHDRRDVVERHAFELRREVADRRRHARHRFPRHRRRGAGAAPADGALVGFEPHQHVLGALHLLERHLERLHHRQADGDGLDALDFHSAGCRVSSDE